MFNERKAAQIAAYFIAKDGGRTHVLKLMKLMYLAEREAMNQYGYPLTFDYPVSMPQGPVLSYTLDCINGSSPQGGWESWVKDREGHEVSVRKKNLSRELLDELSDREVGVLKTVWKRFGHMDRWQLRDYTHKHLSEWSDPSGSSQSISAEDIFLALGRSKSAAEALADQVQQRRKAAAALQAAKQVQTSKKAPARKAA